ncbi:hypothetical protein BASA60_010662 [Batrachochytrium salamandrivorans]|nr:hypothetical protein BASA60_010662 [Batrachochytrium salamandrivorans]
MTLLPHSDQDASLPSPILEDELLCRYLTPTPTTISVGALPNNSSIPSPHHTNDPVHTRSHALPTLQDSTAMAPVQPQCMTASTASDSTAITGTPPSQHDDTKCCVSKPTNKTVLDELLFFPVPDCDDRQAPAFNQRHRSATTMAPLSPKSKDEISESVHHLKLELRASLPNTLSPESYTSTTDPTAPTTSNTLNLPQKSPTGSSPSPITSPSASWTSFGNSHTLPSTKTSSTRDGIAWRSTASFDLDDASAWSIDSGVSGKYALRDSTLKMFGAKRETSRPVDRHTKDRRQFAAWFPEIKDAYDSFINSYSCAWDREMLWQGRVFATRDSVCFYASPFGQVVKLVLDYIDIQLIEKKNSVGILPNAIRISMLDRKQYVLTSFLKRDAAYDLIEYNWTLCNGSALADVSASGMFDKRISISISDDARSRASVTTLSGIGQVNPSNMNMPTRILENTGPSPSVVSIIDPVPTILFPDLMCTSAGPRVEDFNNSALLIQGVSKNRVDTSMLLDNVVAFNDISGLVIPDPNQTQRFDQQDQLSQKSHRRSCGSSCDLPHSDTVTTNQGSAPVVDTTNLSITSSILPKDDSELGRKSIRRYSTKNTSTLAPHCSTTHRGINTPDLLGQGVKEKLTKSPTVSVACSCESHTGTVICDTQISLGVDVAYAVMFGPNSTIWTLSLHHVFGIQLDDAMDTISQTHKLPNYNIIYTTLGISAPLQLLKPGIPCIERRQILLENPCHSYKVKSHLMQDVLSDTLPNTPTRSLLVGITAYFCFTHVSEGVCRVCSSASVSGESVLEDTESQKKLLMPLGAEIRKRLAHVPAKDKRDPTWKMLWLPWIRIPVSGGTASVLMAVLVIVGAMLNGLSSVLSARRDLNEPMGTVMESVVGIVDNSAGAWPTLGIAEEDASKKEKRDTDTDTVATELDGAASFETKVAPELDSPDDILVRLITTQKHMNLLSMQNLAHDMVGRLAVVQNILVGLEGLISEASCDGGVTTKETEYENGGGTTKEAEYDNGGDNIKETEYDNSSDTTKETEYDNGGDNIKETEYDNGGGTTKETKYDNGGDNTKEPEYDNSSNVGSTKDPNDSVDIRLNAGDAPDMSIPKVDQP